MTEKTNESTESISAEEARKLTQVDELKADKASAQTANSASQAHSEEVPVVRKLVVPEQSPPSSDPDDDRSPGLVGRSVEEALQAKAASAEQNPLTSEESQSESK